jgi:hypothetical protein
MMVKIGFIIRPATSVCPMNAKEISPLSRLTDFSPHARERASLPYPRPLLIRDPPKFTINPPQNGRFA